MKKLTTTIILIFTIATFCFSQEFSKWQIGILYQSNVDTRYNEFTGQQQHTLENIAGSRVGLLANYNWKYWFVEFGLNYDKRKSYLYERTFVTNDDDLFVLHFMDLAYLNLPVNIGFRYPTKFGNPYIQTGVYYNRLLTSDYTYEDRNRNNAVETRPQSAFNQNLVGGQIYLGYQTPNFKRFLLDLSLHYNQDFTYFTNDTYDFINRGIGLTLRLKYNL
jgi:hypothetical protein